MTMTLIELLAQAQRAGITIERNGTRIGVRGPHEAQALAEQVLVRKDEVLACWPDRPEVANWSRCGLCGLPVDPAALVGGFRTHPMCDDAPA